MVTSFYVFCYDVAWDQTTDLRTDALSTEPGRRPVYQRLTRLYLRISFFLIYYFWAGVKHVSNNVLILM